MVKDGNISDKRASAGLKRYQEDVDFAQAKIQANSEDENEDEKMKIYYNNIYLKIL
jgi:hypothetical protein